MTENVQKAEISILKLLAGIVASNNDSIDIPISAVEHDYDGKSIGIHLNQETRMITLFLQDKPEEVVEESAPYES